MSVAVACQRAPTSPPPSPGFPSTVSCLNGDLAGLFAYLGFPVEHHKRLRRSNFIEQTFGGTRRRVKVIDRFLPSPPRTCCLSRRDHHNRRQTDPPQPVTLDEPAWLTEGFRPPS